MNETVRLKLETVLWRLKAGNQEVPGTLTQILAIVSETQGDNLIPLHEWNKYHDYPKVKTLRKFRFYNTDKFNDRCAVKSGVRVLLKEASVLDWIRQRGEL